MKLVVESNSFYFVTYSILWFPWTLRRWREAQSSPIVLRSALNQVVYFIILKTQQFGLSDMNNPPPSSISDYYCCLLTKWLMSPLTIQSPRLPGLTWSPPRKSPCKWQHCSDSSRDCTCSAGRPPAPRTPWSRSPARPGSLARRAGRSGGNISARWAGLTWPCSSCSSGLGTSWSCRLTAASPPGSCTPPRTDSRGLDCEVIGSLQTSQISRSSLSPTSGPSLGSLDICCNGEINTTIRSSDMIKSFTFESISVRKCLPRLLSRVWQFCTLQVYV